MSFTKATKSAFPLLIVPLVLVANTAHARVSEVEDEEQYQLLEQQCDKLIPKLLDSATDSELEESIDQSELGPYHSKPEILEACKHLIFALEEITALHSPFRRTP
ncbi:hypothetical protein TSAR_007672 [Trichomalopsis sarcophagae]|uniref:Secreted protein n=1 Tax=Trichomalopsis sarcophagae TaxID=543379 RepID=A0A232F5R0_9HYME|nr:hypothetical protein TSAR_007672 [Trichomalopsis sarcophagae]